MTIRFDSDRHAQLVDSLREATAAIERHLDDLDAAVDAGRAEWTGEARAAYDIAHRQWSDALARLTANLAATTSGMDTARSRFVMTEGLAARLWD